MSDWKKSLWPTTIILGLIGSFVGGNQVRVHQELGVAPKDPGTFAVASLELPTNTPRTIAEGEYFYQLMQLLERDFVEPVTDERKLALGSVKGMIGGLWDPLSQFLPKDHYPEQLARLKGDFAGIGVEIRTVYSPKELDKVRKNARSADPLLLLPELRVAFVAPDGPADKAGLKVGDRISKINGRWLLAWSDVIKLRDLQKKVASGQSKPEEFKKVRVEIQTKAKDSMTVGRAIDLLTSGSGKSIDLAWKTESSEGHANLTTAITTVPAVKTNGDGSVSVRLFSGVSEALRAVPNVTSLDLRDSSLGSAAEIEKVLVMLKAPDGVYGAFVPEKGGQSRTLSVKSGSTSPVTMRVLVNSSTRGAAEALALALKAKGAEVVGEPMAGEPVWIETVKLEDGSGYTLNTGRFQPASTEAKR